MKAEGGDGGAVGSRAGEVARLRVELAALVAELAALVAELELLRVWAAGQEARQARLEALAAVVEGWPWYRARVTAWCAGEPRRARGLPSVQRNEWDERIE